MNNSGMILTGPAHTANLLTLPFAKDAVIVAMIPMPESFRGITRCLPMTAWRKVDYDHS